MDMMQERLGNLERECESMKKLVNHLVQAKRAIITWTNEHVDQHSVSGQASFAAGLSRDGRISRLEDLMLKLTPVVDIDNKVSQVAKKIEVIKITKKFKSLKAGPAVYNLL